MAQNNDLMQSSFHWLDLVGCYQQSHRVYHDTCHVHDMLRLAHTLCNQDDMPWMEAVIWLHDAYHDPKAPHGQNERRSADLLNGMLGEAFTDQGRALARAAIEASAHHFQDQSGLHPLVEILLDIDMGGLGGNSESFSRHTRRVSEEYQRVGTSDEDIAKGHEKFAKAMLARRRIYYSDKMHEQYEECARANLARLAASPKDFI
jgi:predicted metal-dependent HD superfamily phosphohydrolase